MFEKMEAHIGHNIECVGYGKAGKHYLESCSIECIDCNEVIYNEDNNF